MNWKEWKEFYLKIVKELNIDPKADEKSAKILECNLIKNSSTNQNKINEDLCRILQKPVIIAGAGPSLENDLHQLISYHQIKRISLVAVDGATTLFKELNLIPKVVVTDLDGDITAIHWAILNGALTLIHAHGDNQELISHFFNKFNEIISLDNVWGTTQCKPNKILDNYGGFTDGDRAVFLAFHFQSPLIGLIGFDFGTVIGKYSLMNSPIKKSPEQKKIKFQIALSLLNSLYSQHDGLRFNLTSNGQQLSGFLNISFSNFFEYLDECNFYE
jgi:uncharacterized Rossmann fold enzyme